MFTAEAAAVLAGPAWLRNRRRAAAERFAASNLPTAEEEVWRYSPINELDLDAYRPLADGEELGAPPGYDILDDQPAAVTTVTVVGGRLRSIVPDTAAMGVWIGRLADAPDGADALGSVATEPPDVFTVLNDALCDDPLLVRVGDGVRVAQPIVISHVVGGEHTATFPRLVIQAGPNSDVTVVEHFFSVDSDLLVVPVTEIDVGRAARVGYVNVQELGAQTWQIASQVSRVGQEASLLSASAALGGHYARLRTDCRLEGRGATGDLLSAYFGEGDQTLDFRTFQEHRAPDTTSNLLFKGAVGGRSRSVYTGLIRVHKEARGTNAFQTNRNIKLSDEAWAESVPNLEIENNDVRCSHASTVGPIDAEQRFYLESRGVPPQVASRLVVAGFFDEVIRRIPVPGLAGPLRARIGAKLDRAGDQEPLLGADR